MMQTVTDRAPTDTPEVTLEDALAQALIDEVALLDKLREVFVLQREALRTGDPFGLDDGVFAATRILRTFHEAQRRRRDLVVRLVGENVSPDEFDTVFTGTRDKGIRVAHRKVRGAAVELRRELTTLRRILEVALSDNRRYLEALLGGVEDHEAGVDVSDSRVVDRTA